MIFVTNEGMTATSPDINAYNAFVTAEAALNPSLPSGVTWNAVISTPTVNANTNAVSVAGLPIYNTQGIEVASGATGLYTPSLLAPVEYNQYGDLPNLQGLPVYAWTGSDTSGVGVPGAQAGNGDGFAWAGYVYLSDSQWMDYLDLPQDADPPGYHSFSRAQLTDHGSGTQHARTGNHDAAVRRIRRRGWCPSPRPTASIASGLRLPSGVEISEIKRMGSAASAASPFCSRRYWCGGLTSSWSPAVGPDFSRDRSSSRARAWPACPNPF